jgi:hypothetical protein
MRPLQGRRPLGVAVHILDGFVDAKGAAAAVDKRVAVRGSVAFDATDEVVDGLDVDKLERPKGVVVVKERGARGGALANASENERARRSKTEGGRSGELKGDEVFELAEVSAPDEFRPPVTRTSVLVNH